MLYTGVYINIQYIYSEQYESYMGNTPRNTDNVVSFSLYSHSSCIIKFLFLFFFLTISFILALSFRAKLISSKFPVGAKENRSTFSFLTLIRRSSHSLFLFMSLISLLSRANLYRLSITCIVCFPHSLCSIFVYLMLYLSSGRLFDHLY